MLSENNFGFFNHLQYPPEYKFLSRLILSGKLSKVRTSNARSKIDRALNIRTQIRYKLSILLCNL